MVALPTRDGATGAPLMRVLNGSPWNDDSGVCAAGGGRARGRGTGPPPPRAWPRRPANWCATGDRLGLKGACRGPPTSLAARVVEPPAGGLRSYGVPRLVIVRLPATTNPIG